MTGDTTPQQQAVELIRKFIVTNVGYDEGYLMTVQAQELAILLSDAGLLQVSSLRSSEASPTSETQWAVLRADDDEIYSSRDSAEHCLRFLLEGNMDYRLYEIREVRS
jgi:hypothetical protein